MRHLILLISLNLTISFTQAQISHQKWDVLLKEHVSTDGKVDYKGFIQDLNKLDAYLTLLSENPPKTSWTKNQKLAYWINAYNAFTVKLISDNYPLKSIQELHPTVKIPGISTVWHKAFFQIGGEDESLNDIEHKILRKQFDEPRIHFAINCASFSCPNLRNEAYTPSKLEMQLEEQTKAFINDPTKNTINTNEIEISKIFSWFKKDFTKQESLIAFLNKYAATQIDSGADINHKAYNWMLNE
ncbi:MAG: DUF547 domain-containing protein [Flammeovirgaceae bacterium]